MQYKLIDLAKIYFSKLTTSEYAAYIMIAAFFIILVYLVLIEMRYSILKGRIKKLCAKKDELESYLQNLNIEFENLLNNYNDLRERKSEVEKELDYINKQVDAKRILLKDLEKEIVEIRKLKLALEGRIESLIQKLKDYSIEIKVKEYLFEKLKGFKARNLSHVFNILLFLMMFFFATVYYSSVHSKVPLIRSAYAEIAYLIGWALLWSFTLFVYKHSISAMNETLKNYEPRFDAIKHADEIENELRVYIDRKNALISITEEKAKKETDRTPKDEDRVVDVQPVKVQSRERKSPENLKVENSSVDELNELSSQIFKLRIQKRNLFKECKEYEKKIQQKRDEYRSLDKNVKILELRLKELRDSMIKYIDKPRETEADAVESGLVPQQEVNNEEEQLKTDIALLEAKKKKLEKEVESLQEQKDDLDEKVDSLTMNKVRLIEEIDSLKERKKELKSEVFPLEGKRKEFDKLNKKVEQLKDERKKLRKEKRLLEKSLAPLYEIKNNWEQLKYFVPPDFLLNDETIYSKKIDISRTHGTIWGTTVNKLDDIKNGDDRKLFESVLRMPYVESIRIGENLDCDPIPKPILEIVKSQDQQLLNKNIVKLRFRTSDRGSGTSHMVYVKVKGSKSCKLYELFIFFTLVTLLSFDQSILAKS